jgi:ribonuclease-3
MNDIHQILLKIPEIEKRIGYRFTNPQLLILAFIHRSYVNEHREVKEHNERLEFLGDSVLGLLISDYLYRSLPEVSEGDLSAIRSRIVNAASCVNFVQKLELEKFIILGKGERFNDGRGRETILSDLFEALIGAIYLDGGIEAARTFILTQFGTEINAIMKGPMQNAKAILQDLCQKKYQCMPLYQVKNISGPDHSKNFEVSVSFDGNEIGIGMGSSKKLAQEAAAQDALSRNRW